MRNGDATESGGAHPLHEAFHSLLASNPLPVWVHDAESLRFLEVNEAALACYGYGRDQFLRMSLPDIRAGEVQGDLQRAVAERDDPIRSTGASRHRRADGTLLDVDMVAQELEWAGCRASLVIVHEVRESCRLPADLSPPSCLDEATRLANAAMLVDRIAAAFGRAERARYVGVVVVGLPVLDTVATTAGEAAADALVTAVARRLRACGKTNDQLARLGGGRFAMLCESDERRGILSMAAALVAALDEPIHVAGFGEVRAVPAVGVALGDEEDRDASALVRDATATMHHVAERGGGFLVADPSLRQAAREALETQEALSAALGDGQLRLVYQPIVDLRDGEIDTCEALVRWDRPGVGLLGPEHFLPLAERTGLIVELGTWVIERSIDEAATWPGRTSTRPRVGINLAARQLRDPYLVERVADACAAAGLSQEALCVELTESAFVTTDDYTSYRALAALREAGVQVAIDDFGTGYSNLFYLKHLPIDVVKIDHGFIAGLGRDRTDTLLVEAIIGVAHGLGVRVVAEGVETEFQLDALRKLGCDAAQGYLLARPVPARDLTSAIRRANRVVAG